MQLLVPVEPYCLEYLPLIARNTKRIVIKAIRENPVVVELVSEELKNDRDIVMRCMKHELATVALNHLPEYWRDDYDVIWTAVTNCGPALHYASERLRNNTTLVEAAIEHGQYSVIEYLSDELRFSPTVMRHIGPSVVNSSGDVFAPSNGTNIVKLDSKLATGVTSFGEKGDKPGQFKCANILAVDNNGSLHWWFYC